MWEYRQKMNERILGMENLQIRRFFALDQAVFEDGALPRKTKEMLGLVASLVLRCEGCIMYHLKRCRDMGVTEAELQEIFAIALVIGGSIIIPELRRAVELMDEIMSKSS